MLPGVPPTNRHVEVALVAIVRFRDGKLAHEHIYWDQASVLVQVGLLDPNVVPKTFKASGGKDGEEEWEVERLPAVGGEGARKVVDEEVGESNELIDDWLDE